ncbi:MAG: hypothetical protein EBU97_04055, partial [Rhodobacteraceae bacterium]|nr:hypothetical protein [Paracoccaceae bacterium]
STASTDLAASSLTTGTITVGGTATSTIDAAGDSDWFGVDLVAGHTYTITENGSGTAEGTLSDPYFLGVYNSNGLVLAGSADDNSGGSSNAQVTVTITQSGHYYLAASAAGAALGSYTLALSEVADTTAPTLVGVSPTDNATAVAANSNLSLTFSEAVVAGTGSFTISNGTDIRTISASDAAQVTFAGTTVTINPTSDLATGSAYSVTYDGAAVKDLAGNAAAAVTSATTWNFTTSATAGPADSWTIMVYIAGDNNLESFALSDLNEMEQVNYPSSVNVYALADRAAGYSNASGNWTDTREGHIVYDGSNTTVTSLSSSATSRGELNTGLGANLTAFINRAVAADPAQHYALILWDHGGGTSGSCWDDGSGGDNLTLAEMRSAIDASIVDHFDIVGFDACLMSMAEQAFDLRGLADILVASEELEPGDGWDYNVFLQALANNPTMTSQQLASSMVSSYAPQYAGQSDITMAATNIAGMTALEQGLDSFVSAALALGAGNADWAAMRSAAAAARAMPSDASFDYADLGDFMSGVASRVSDSTLKAAAQSVVSAVHSAVFAQSGTVAAATGLSIYLPYGSEVVDSSYTSANYSFLQAVNWDGYLALL